MMNLYRAVASDPLSASLLWSEAGVCRSEAAPMLRQPRFSRRQAWRGQGHLFTFRHLLEGAR